MNRTYIAVFSIDGDAIRVVYIAESDLEIAREKVLQTLPDLADVSVTFHEVSNGLGARLKLRPGQLQEWWLGEVLIPSQLFGRRWGAN